jgi:hypothetical protein
VKTLPENRSAFGGVSEGDPVPLADQFQAAADRARTLAQLEDLSRLLWRANGEGHVDDDRAGAISEAVEARRAKIKGMRPPPLPSRSTGRRRPPTSPDRRASIERRRRTAASGAMPPALAANFTTGEAAVLTVIGREVQRSGRCEFYLDKIAALAGVCRSTAQNALHEARRLGLVIVTERRRRGAKSLTNVVEIVSAEWRAWLRIGSKNFDTTGRDSKTRTEIALRSTAERGLGAPTAPVYRHVGANAPGASFGRACGGGNKEAWR